MLAALLYLSAQYSLRQTISLTVVYAWGGLEGEKG